MITTYYVPPLPFRAGFSRVQTKLEGSRDAKNLVPLVRKTCVENGTSDADPPVYVLPTRRQHYRTALLGLGKNECTGGLVRGCQRYAPRRGYVGLAKISTLTGCEPTNERK